MLSVPALLQRCRERGVKVTAQRIAIFECLAQRQGHLSAEEVYQDVLPRYPTLSFATVYNTLQLLTELGEVHELIVDELRRRYDVNTDPHHHAVCRACHRIFDVEPAVLGAWAKPEIVPLAGGGFRVETVSIELTGLCDTCEGAAPPKTH
jgi:Fur family peroxide stress response transcriptional regulator